MERQERLSVIGYRLPGYRYAIAEALGIVPGAVGATGVQLVGQSAATGDNLASSALLHCAKSQSLDELFLGEPSEHHDRSHRKERCGG
jgi:hypothetical protein